jgi:proline-rich protein PRCC
VKVASLTYDASSGTTQTVFKPSKTQKRKHQINSLAYSAAERELELMEKKGQSNKTKSQTQAKYGW